MIREIPFDNMPARVVEAARRYKESEGLTFVSCSVDDMGVFIMCGKTPDYDSLPEDEHVLYYSYFGPYDKGGYVHAYNALSFTIAEHADSFEELVGDAWKEILDACRQEGVFVDGIESQTLCRDDLI